MCRLLTEESPAPPVERLLHCLAQTSDLQLPLPPPLPLPPLRAEQLQEEGRPQVHRPPCQEVRAVPVSPRRFVSMP